jgi:hypothetical protein
METKSFTYTQEKKLADLQQFSNLNFELSSKELSENQVNIIVQLLNRADELNNNIEEYDEELFQIEIENIAKQVKIVSEHDTEYITLAVEEPIIKEMRVFVISVSSGDNKTWGQFSDEEFISHAEEQKGNSDGAGVYTLKSFEKAINYEQLITEQIFIRFIEVEINE